MRRCFSGRRKDCDGVRRGRGGAGVLGVWHRRGGEGRGAIGPSTERYAGAIAALGVLVLPPALGASYACCSQPHTCCSHSSTRLPPPNPHSPCLDAASASMRGQSLQHLGKSVKDM